MKIQPVFKDAAEWKMSKPVDGEKETNPTQKR
jgi:hypothetical protein